VPAPPPSLDALIPRLRERAADPERRTFIRETQFSRQMSSLDLGGVLSLGRTLGGLLRTSVTMQREGRIDPEGVAMADEIQRRMETPVDDGLPAPADEATVEAAEAVLRLTLPVAMRRVWMEVADGGFGPGFGLLPLGHVVKEYGSLRSPGMMPRGREWPAGLLPVLSQDPGWDCIEASTGRVIGWDPEDLSERSSEARFQASFSEVAPSVEAWLDEWLGAKTHAEQRDEMMAEFTSPAYQARQAREARDAIRRMSLEERRAILGRLAAWTDAPPPLPRARPLDAAGIAALAGRPGHAVGAHGAHHLALGSQPAAALDREVGEGTRRLAEVLGRPVEAFAYPYGDVSDAAVAAVAAAGLGIAVTCEEAPLRAGADLLRLPRLEVKADGVDALSERMWRLLR